MIVTYAGRDWDFDVDKVTVEEWRELKRKYSMTPKGFQDGTQEADPDCMTFAWWILLRQDGQAAGSLGDHLKPDVIALNNAIAAGAEQEAAEEEERKRAELEAAAAAAAAAVPTRPAGHPSSARPGRPTSGPTTPGPLLSTPDGSGSSTETSSSSTPSTSLSSPGSADSPPETSGG